MPAKHTLKPYSNSLKAFRSLAIKLLWEALKCIHNPKPLPALQEVAGVVVKCKRRYNRLCLIGMPFMKSMKLIIPSCFILWKNYLLVLAENNFFHELKHDRMTTFKDFMQFFLAYSIHWFWLNQCSQRSFDKLLTVSGNIGSVIIDGEKCKDYKKYLPGKAWNTAKNSENVISQISEKLFGFWLDTWFW